VASTAAEETVAQQDGQADGRGKVCGQEGQGRQEEQGKRAQLPQLIFANNSKRTIRSQDKQKEEPEASSAASVSSSSSSTLPPVRSTHIANSVQHQEEEDALECLELPPPMKPIQDASQIVGDESGIQSSSNPSGSKALDENDLAEIEQIVKEKMVSAIICIESLARD
jgi:hypothetical protein